MKIPDLPREKMGWDSWRRFYWNVGKLGVELPSQYSRAAIVVFDTDEVVLTPFATDLGQRGSYEHMNLSIRGTKDEKCPPLYYNEQKVPKAWLNDRGQQILLIDHDYKIAVAVSRIGLVKMTPALDSRIPINLRGRAHAYYPGQGAPPVGGSAIKLARPVKILTAEQQAHIEELVIAAKTYTQLTGRGLGVRALAPADPVELAAIKSVEELSIAQLASIHRYGVGRAVIHVPFLTLEPEKSQ